MMLKLFDIVPSWIYALALIILVSFSGLTYTRLEKVKIDFSQYKLVVAENTAKAESLARNKEQELQAKIDMEAQDANKRENKLKEIIANSNNSVVSLRDTIERLNASPVSSDSSPAKFWDEARTARQLLGSCASKYRQLAEDADGLRDQVITLQQYASSVQGSH